jgi:hypothetical protein
LAVEVELQLPEPPTQYLAVDPGLGEGEAETEGEAEGDIDGDKD